MKKSLTRLEAERQSKKIAGELEEELSVTGQESDTKAVKWVQEKGRERRKKEKEEKAEAVWKAHDARGKIFTYRDVILQYMMKEMYESYEQLPVGFLWYPVKDKRQGIILYIKDPIDKWYARGMKISMIPHMDIQCVDRLIEKALNHMDALEQKYKKEEKIVV